jgi:hypothetical protein
MKGLVHSEVLEEIERLVYKGLIHSMQITVRNSIVTVLCVLTNVSGFDFYCVRLFYMPPFCKQ